MSTIDASQIAKAFSNALQQGAPLRAQAVQHLGQRQQTESSALTIEQSRVVSRFGSNSAEGQQIQARVLAHTARGNTVALEMQRSQVSVPHPTADGFIVYGLIVDSTGKARKGVQIRATSTAYAALASTKSDGQGAFLLCVPTTSRAHVKDNPDAKETGGSGASQKTGEKSSTASDKAGAAPKMQSFQLVLSTKALTFRNPETFQVTAGQVAYREIVFPVKPLKPVKPAKPAKTAKPAKSTTTGGKSA
jgi:hypothetical protein